MVCMSLAIFTNIKAWKSGGLFTVTWNEQKNEFKGTNLEVSGVSGDILKNHKHTELEVSTKNVSLKKKTRFLDRNINVFLFRAYILIEKGRTARSFYSFFCYMAG